MANLIPRIDPNDIMNDGERTFYRACMKLGDDYTVFYSFKYKDLKREHINEYEIDFVIVHPELGYVTVEIKQGEVVYKDSLWYEYKQKTNNYSALRKDPIQQAKTAMYAIRDIYINRTNKPYFPLTTNFAICFPECSKICGSLPSEINEDNIILEKDLYYLQTKVNILLKRKKGNNREAYNELYKILNPKFQVFDQLEDRIKIFHRTSELILTEEQNRILEETDLDNRKIFFGSAGTGKTFIAMEKARRLAINGRKVLLTCYNKNLAKQLLSNVGYNIKVYNFHEYLMEVLKNIGQKIELPVGESDKKNYFNYILPEQLIEYYSKVSENEKFDAIIVDEGQDFIEEWFTCLEYMLKKDGDLFVFADPLQNIYNINFIKKLPISKHKLTLNLRNTNQINQYLKEIKPEITVRSVIEEKFHVKEFYYKDYVEEKRCIQNEIGRLISQGVSCNRITILSPLTKRNSCLNSISTINGKPIVNYFLENEKGIKFSTIKSFKGLESDIVFLIDIDTKNEKLCTDNDLYVGISRARFLLNIFKKKQ